MGVIIDMRRRYDCGYIQIFNKSYATLTKGRYAMNLSPRLQESFNNQITAEFESAFIYLSMASYFEDRNLPGFAHWMRLQNAEETAHAMRFFDYVHDRGGRATLQAIPQPPADFQSALDVMERTLDHERKITGLINRMYQLAIEESDYAAQVMLHELINEQVEEEKSAEEIVDQLRLIDGDGSGLLLIDARLAARA